MKGIIFNLVEDAVTAQHGEAVWDRLLLDAGVDGGYTSLGDYPDAELFALVAAASAALEAPPEAVLRTLGHSAVLGLAGMYPHFFTPHTTTADFVVTLNDVIHPEVRKIHRNATPPEFGFERGPEGLRVEYRSHRGLCALAEGMIGGAATYYGEHAAVTHEQCTHQGDSVCVLQCSFSPSLSTAEAGTGGDD